MPQNLHVLTTELRLLMQDQLMKAKLTCDFSVMLQAPQERLWEIQYTGYLYKIIRQTGKQLLQVSQGHGTKISL